MSSILGLPTSAMTPDQLAAYTASMESANAQATANTNQQNTNSTNSSDNSSGQVPNGSDPTVYVKAYDKAIKEGRSPSQAAQVALEAAPPLKNTGSTSSTGNTGSTGSAGAAVSGSSSSDASTIEVARPNLKYVNAGATANADATGATATTSQDSATQSTISTIVASTTSTNSANGKGISIDPSDFYNQLMSIQGMTADEAEAATTNVFADLTANANGDVTLGTMGTVNVGGTQQQVLDGTTELKADVANTANQLIANPSLVKLLADAGSTADVQKIIDQGVTAGLLTSLTPKDSEGKAVTSPGSSSGKGTVTRSLNPMEMVMVAMMDAAVEGQKQAADLADEVSANTDLKKKLRGEKDAANTVLQAEGLTGTSATTSSGSSLSSAQLADVKAYNDADTQLSDAGDDSSILMIKLQSAAQIVTTFLQACSNVSKGVTDTTKAVIGNIGH